MIIFKFKVLLLGAAAVGKTSLLHRFVNNVFKKDYSATIGVQFLLKEVMINGVSSNDEKIQLAIWDIAGQQRFEDLRTTFYRGSHGALLIFDLTRENTFKELSTWHSEMIKVLGKDVPFALIGNKSDLVKKNREKINRSEIIEFAKAKNSIYIETSAKTGQNVENAFLELTRLIAAKESGMKLPKRIIKKSTEKKEAINYIVKSKGNTSSMLVNGNALNKIIKEILDKAIARAKANRRKTVKQIDI
ncbi:MAG: GTP-binding protein [Promethearchaeota archaeon]